MDESPANAEASLRAAARSVGATSTPSLFRRHLRILGFCLAAFGVIVIVVYNTYNPSRIAGYSLGCVTSVERFAFSRSREFTVRLYDGRTVVVDGWRAYHRVGDEVRLNHVEYMGWWRHTATKLPRYQPRRPCGVPI